MGRILEALRSVSPVHRVVVRVVLLYLCLGSAMALKSLGPELTLFRVFLMPAVILGLVMLVRLMEWKGTPQPGGIIEAALIVAVFGALALGWGSAS
jgi:hypothetical protein